MHDTEHWKAIIRGNPSLAKMLTPRMTAYIAQSPTPKQAAFLLLPHKEALYGGAAGGGKSSTLLMGALQYVDVPGYAALLLRRTYADLALPGALMARAQEWLAGTDATYNDQKKVWTFPSGATVSFGYLQSPRDVYRYQSSEFQYIAFDELTQFPEASYLYMFSRLRRNVDVPVPLRMRGGTNPGGIGHQWVYQRFFAARPPERIFIPSRLDDNPHIDKQEYVKALAELDPVTRKQLLEGDWNASYEGGMFKRQWFKLAVAPPKLGKLVRYWDMASTEPSSANPDPDYLVGCKMGRDEQGNWWIVDMQRARLSPRGAELLIRRTAEADGMGVAIRMEEEPGSSGKAMIEHYRSNVLPDFEFKGVRNSNDKETRAKPVSAQAEAGKVHLVQGAWVNDFLDEAVLFPYGAHDDQIDGMSGAYHELISAQPSIARVQVSGLYRSKK